jgi:ABC-type lipoprotein release transport system permease subunit
MFLTYLRRELRRRMRQAIFIALGLALGIGLVITVTAASSGVSNSQGTVLASLYGVGTDVTVTQTPAAGSGGPARFGFGGSSGRRPSAGTSFSRSVLTSGGLGTLPSSDVRKVSGLKDVSAVAGALSLTDLKLSGTINAGGSGGGAAGGASGARSSIKSSSFSVTGVDLANGSLGPLSSGTIAAGHNFSSADSTADVAVVDASYAKAENLKTGSTFKVAGTKFTVIGIVRVAQGSTSADVYIPLARAQSLASMKNTVNTVYVSAASAADIGAVSSEISTALPKATVTTSSDLASEVTGSLSSASSLADNLGRWLAVAVLAAAFGLASLLTVAAVSRRVREFGTLKALGWRNRRILRQIMGEALAIGLIGGAAGVALGFGGAALVQALAPPLTATTATSTPAGPGGAGGAGGPGTGGGFAHAAQSTAHTVSVHLTAPVTLSAVLLAVVLALAGGLIAGSFGGWRAVRLRPAAALARVV